MKRTYSALSYEIIEFSENDVIRTSGEDYTKDVIVGNDDFTDELIGDFGGLTAQG